MQEENLKRREIEAGLLGRREVSRRKTVFEVDLMYADPKHVFRKRAIPNWRDRHICTGCRLNSRIRCSIHFLEEYLKADTDDAIFLNEQTTLLYSHLKSKYPRLLGSEYLGRSIPFGEVDARTGVRNESLANLSFDDESFRCILSFDVFEHIPEYLLAFKECLRCLKEGGTLFFSVPFNCHGEEKLVRAKVDDHGKVKHILPPEYHGDPMTTNGCLCFYHFGWELLDQLRQIGFSSASGHILWSDQLGYLGDNQILFTAQK